MTQGQVVEILLKIDAVEAELRGCETRLTAVRDMLLRANNMGRLLNSRGELKPERQNHDVCAA